MKANTLRCLINRGGGQTKSGRGGSEIFVKFNKRGRVKINGGGGSGDIYV